MNNSLSVNLNGKQIGIKKAEDITEFQLESPMVINISLTICPKKIKFCTDEIITKQNIKKENTAKLCFDGKQINNISEEDIDAWSKAFPAVDIQSEILRAAQWLMANPTKMKKNIRRFLINWFARKQERGGELELKKTKPEPRLII